MVTRRLTEWPALALAALAFSTVVAGCGRDGGDTQSPQDDLPHLGFLSASASPAFIDALEDGLAELGYVDGETVRLELHATEDEAELPGIAAELVGVEVDVIVAGGTKAVEAAKDATTTIPIVMTNSGDPVATGLVDALAEPGGNVTGLTQSSPQLSPKRLELLQEAFPGTTRVAALFNPEHPATKLSAEELSSAAPDFGIEVVTLAVTDEAAITGAIEGAKDGGATALVVLRDPFTVNAASVIVGAADAAGLPAMYETRNFLDAGGLMLYGPDLADLYRRSAGYVDKILDGEDPSTMPIGQPTEFELVISTAAEARLGVEIAESVRVRAELVD